MKGGANICSPSLSKPECLCTSALASSPWPTRATSLPLAGSGLAETIECKVLGPGRLPPNIGPRAPKGPSGLSGPSGPKILHPKYYPSGPSGPKRPLGSIGPQKAPRAPRAPKGPIGPQNITHCRLSLAAGVSSNFLKCPAPRIELCAVLQEKQSINRLELSFAQMHTAWNPDTADVEAARARHIDRAAVEGKLDVLKPRPQQQLGTGIH